MSAAFLVCASIALLLFLVLLASLAALRRLERSVGDDLEGQASRGERHRGPSGDLHLYLGFDDAAQAAALLAGPKAERDPSTFAELIAALRGALPAASHACVEYGHFRPISVRFRPSLTVVYVNLRLRSPVDATFAASDVAAWTTLFDTLEALGPARVVELRVTRGPRTTDPASPELVRLDRSAT